MNILQSFSFIPHMASEVMIFGCFRKFRFWLPWQPIKFGGFDKTDMFGRGLLKKHFCKTFVKVSDLAVNTNFIFFHYKSMATLS